VLLAGGAFALGTVLGSGGGSPAVALAQRYARSWSRGDFAAMYGDLDASSQRAMPPSAFAAALGQAMATATATKLTPAGLPRVEREGLVAIPVNVATRLFGVLRLTLRLPVHEEGAAGERVRWTPSLVFPGLQPGERLTSRLVMPPRAPLLAADGSVLAEGPSGDAVATGGEPAPRSSPLGAAASAVAGTVGPVPPDRRTELESEGVPADALVGLSGLELALDPELRGRAGGELLAGTRALAAASPRAAPPLRTTISPSMQVAAVTALGGHYGGIVVLRPQNGEILAVAGIGLEGLQPPGSTFKMITATGVLASHLAGTQTAFPYATYATLDGVKLHNAGGEECGGTLEAAFAVSCNSVFAPLGVRLGAARLVATAEAYGFNSPPGIQGAPASTLPAASSIQGELALGSTAIGQGEVLATPLEMATVAATIAELGRRPRPTFVPAGQRPFVARASSSAVARTVRHLMVEVVRSGTGTAAAIPGVTVAGKTGTAELASQCVSRPPGTSAEGAASESSGEATGGEGHAARTCQGTETEASNTDAWFAAFAPALHPRIVVCVMLVKDGAGGATAAPVAREVIEAALQGGA
jgi:penicillin-binding protein A